MPNFTTPWSQELVDYIKANYVDDYAVIDEFAATGSLWMWGGNYRGDNVAGSKSSPVQTASGGTNWKQVSSGVDHRMAVKTDGTLWGWGNQFYNQVNGSGGADLATPIQVLVSDKWKYVSASGNNTAAIRTDGTLWLWGPNTSGQLGNNNTGLGGPTQTTSGGNNWKTVSTGVTTVAIKTDGTLWTWGDNSLGQLGNNNAAVTMVSSPIQTVSGGTNWKQVTSSAYGETIAAIKTDGTLWLWGSNGFAQIGDNTTAHKSSPVQTVAGGTNWKQVAATHYNTAAIKTDGTLWVWGDNSAGQLGDNTVVSKSSPVQTVAGGTNWKQTSAGYYGVSAIKTDGTLWTWGRNTGEGTLGDNTVVSKSSPVQTVAGGNNWKSLMIGYYRTNGAIHFYDAGNLYPNA